MPTLCGVAVHGLRQVAQHVDDLDRAVGFYADVLGLELVARFDPPGLAFFRLGDVRLLLEHGAPSALLYVGVSDVAAEVARLRGLGVRVEADAHVIFQDDDGRFGAVGEAEVMAFVRDSEGNLLGLSARAPA